VCIFFENTKEKFKIYLENALKYWKRKIIFSWYLARQRPSAYFRCGPSPFFSSRARSSLGRAQLRPPAQFARTRFPSLLRR
jgi:hypothetical protein